MNRIFASLVVAAVWISAMPWAVAQSSRKGAIQNEEFFIVASVDGTKSQLLLKRPTEVTVLMKVSEKTLFFDENGKGFVFADLRAGDTVWVISSSGQASERAALRVRKGPMTLADLRRIYVRFSPGS